MPAKQQKQQTTNTATIRTNEKKRIYGFIICFGCGYLTTFMSFRLFVKLAAGNPAPFVFLYSTGNVMSLMSSVFLSGPGRQFRLMFDEKRRTTSMVYLAALASSITVCFVPLPTGLKIGLLVSREYRRGTEGGTHSLFTSLVFLG